jgi:hypothetical protein
MLEWGESLRTWALAAEPANRAQLIGKKLPDHRLAYLDYEGPVSDNRGCVTRVDRGTYEVVRENEQELTVRLSGDRLCTCVRIEPVPGDDQRFSFSFVGDSSATVAGA